jgi:hypothetical protein
VNPLIQLKDATRLIFSAFMLAYCSLSLPRSAQAADGGIGNYNTAEGDEALSHGRFAGQGNTAVGYFALNFCYLAENNTAVGTFALEEGAVSGNTQYGNNNTAIGARALRRDALGVANTAVGANALATNQVGHYNTAVGFQALYSNQAFYNTATGAFALLSNQGGTSNTANGISALEKNETGHANTAVGFSTLDRSINGNDNTAIGAIALQHSTGDFNIGLGWGAGVNLMFGSNNIYVANRGVENESNTIRIGDRGVHTSVFIAGIEDAGVGADATQVYIDHTGHLGTVLSSRRFKEEIKPMDKTSEAILALEPVTFRYKQEIDPTGTQQFGLIAEQVEKINPALVVRDRDGKVKTVRYEAVNVMLLNEFLKEHHKVHELQTAAAKQQMKIDEQAAMITKLNATVKEQQMSFQSTAAKQQQEIKAFAASLKEQASQIQKISTQLELSKPAPQTVLNTQ